MADVTCCCVVVWLLVVPEISISDAAVLVIFLQEVAIRTRCQGPPPHSVWQSRRVVSGVVSGDGVGDPDDCPLKWSYNLCCNTCLRPFSARSYWLHFNRNDAT